jgi:FixJ family two-component response regulator
MASAGLIGIVDDDASVRSATAAILESVGFETAPFDSSEAFLESGADAAVACLIADVRLPGMSGLDLQRRLRAAGSSVTVIVVTFGGDDEIRRRAFEGGAAAFFVKPFACDDLIEAVAAALSRRDRAAACGGSPS